ncbi:hypothetical protein D5E87_26475 [Vibrio parahaemolyticus]|nr:hypothetical protein [Vibrio parahaemolyticus]EHV9709136.1 hypothetical protein [Vibrio parahaemolyticus]ODY56389.1 hypothetical protein BBM26_11480 [Vibrio parahaemolyticus]ODY58661.1 hypothetical protein BBM96_07915 [Vibrio parahaemolyticus]ODY66806.1 hypothetical protein BBM97_05125 [Vibrio parahaemolyticus]
MKVFDLVKEKTSQRIFSITSISGDRNGSFVSLVEVHPNDTSEHLYPENPPIIVNILELEAFYESFE